MSDTKDNGGPAFPHSTQEWASPIAEGPKYLADVHYPGMTLRDYFAAKAMQGLVSNGYLNAIWKERVEIAYEIADIMLKAREQ